MNNKGDDQTVRMHRLVCIFVVGMEQKVSEYDQGIPQRHTQVYQVEAQIMLDMKWSIFLALISKFLV